MFKCSRFIAIETHWVSNNLPPMKLFLITHLNPKKKKYQNQTYIKRSVNLIVYFLRVGACNHAASKRSYDRYARKAFWVLTCGQNDPQSLKDALSQLVVIIPITDLSRLQLSLWIAVLHRTSEGLRPYSLLRVGLWHVTLGYLQLSWLLLVTSP